VSLQQVVGIDLGGTKALAGVVTTDGQVHSRVYISSRDQEPEELLDNLAQVARDAAKEANVPWEEIDAVGMGIPGTLDLTRSIVGIAPNLNWHQLAAKAELQTRLGVPVFLENDVRSAALGEHRYGAGRGARSMIAVFVGTGVGGGLIVNGQLYHGARGGAGEIGHVVVLADGPECGCGQRGCVEALSARTALSRYVADAVEAGEQTVLSERVEGGVQMLTSRDIAQAVASNDRVAKKALAHSAHYLGLAIGSLVNAFDPDVIVLGGGVVEAGGAPILDSVLGDDAGLLGAALTGIEGLAAAATA
jgi:glucokinase